MATTNVPGAKASDFHEYQTSVKLIKEVPVIVRIELQDIKGFSSELKKPFDSVFVKSMQDTAKCLSERIPNSILSYQFGPEISLLIIDNNGRTSKMMSGYDAQKWGSVVTSMATMMFNRIFRQNTEVYMVDNLQYFEQERIYVSRLRQTGHKGAVFSGIAFNIVKEDISGYFYLSQLSAINKSVKAVAESCLSPKAIEGKKVNEIVQEMKTQVGVDWSKYPNHLKYGSCSIKRYGKPIPEDNKKNNENYIWETDMNIPIFDINGAGYIKCQLG